jgi:phosphotransferase system HPr (HPr) family protein
MKDLNTMEMPTFNPSHIDGYWQQDIVVLNKHGLHARPSAKIFEKILMPYGESLELHFTFQDGNSILIRSVFDLMSLGLEQGTCLTAKLKYHGEGDNGETSEVKIAEELHSLFLSFCDD